MKRVGWWRLGLKRGAHFYNGPCHWPSRAHVREGGLGSARAASRRRNRAYSLMVLVLVLLREE
jgi:hypothetical protein